eukprot:PhF_6_TR7513/c0_g1_i1/m.11130/K02975/RP-S25e, RPS25; small subunit ribosomal protein S25e
MPPKIETKTKEQKAAAAAASSKSKKKKWSKGKVRDPLDNAVMWDQGTVDKLVAEVPKWKVITVSVISERLKVNGSLAREALKYLEAKDLVKAVNIGKDCRIFTRNVKKIAEEEAAKKEAAAAQPEAQEGAKKVGGGAKKGKKEEA